MLPSVQTVRDFVNWLVEQECIEILPTGGKFMSPKVSQQEPDPFMTDELVRTPRTLK